MTKQTSNITAVLNDIFHLYPRWSTSYSKLLWEGQSTCL